MHVVATVEQQSIRVTVTLFDNNNIARDAFAGVQNPQAATTRRCRCHCLWQKAHASNSKMVERSAADVTRRQSLRSAQGSQQSNQQSNIRSRNSGGKVNFPHLPVPGPEAGVVVRIATPHSRTTTGLAITPPRTRELLLIRATPLAVRTTSCTRTALPWPPLHYYCPPSADRRAAHYPSDCPLFEPSILSSTGYLFGPSSFRCGGLHPHYNSNCNPPHRERPLRLWEFAVGPPSKYQFHGRSWREIALVGTSGSGKSTILKLLTRKYDVTSGKIEIGGEDIRCLNRGDVQDYFGTAPQEVQMFNTTILKNVKYARLDATNEEVIRLANPLIYMRQSCGCRRVTMRKWVIGV